MILDRLERAEQYFPLHPGFAAAFDYLRRTNFDALAAGRHEVDGERLFVVVNRAEGRGHAGAKLESHRKYIDIQYTINGTDEIGWKALRDCTTIEAPYLETSDFGLFSDEPETWVAVAPQKFVIFFPDDAHAPLGAECSLLKAVMKVAVDWS